VSWGVGLNGADLHYVGAGIAGSAVLLVHGFPETWRVFRKRVVFTAQPWLVGSRGQPLASRP
jgi:pimeloyl-ACP methyl ester carboxylesterase